MVKTTVVANILLGLVGIIVAFIKQPGIQNAPVGALGLVAAQVTLPILLLGKQDSRPRLRRIIGMVVVGVGLLVMTVLMTTGHFVLVVGLEWAVAAIPAVFMVWSLIAWRITARPGSAKLSAGWACATAGTLLMFGQGAEFIPAEILVGFLLLAVSVFFLLRQPFHEGLKDLGVVGSLRPGDQNGLSSATDSNASAKELIIANLTIGEQKKCDEWAGRYGRWVAWSFAFPAALTVTLYVLTLMGLMDALPHRVRLFISWPVLVGLLVVAVAVHLIGAVRLRAELRSFLNSTKWAQEQDVQM